MSDSINGGVALVRIVVRPAQEVHADQHVDAVTWRGWGRVKLGPIPILGETMLGVLRRSGLLVLSVPLIASPGRHASPPVFASNAFMSLRGAQQGAINGGSLVAGHKNEFEIVAYSASPGVGSAPSTFKVTVTSDGLVNLLKAISTDDVLDVAFTFDATGGGGQASVVQARNAKLTQIAIVASAGNAVQVQLALTAVNLTSGSAATTTSGSTGYSLNTPGASPAGSASTGTTAAAPITSFGSNTPVASAAATIGASLKASGVAMPPSVAKSPSGQQNLQSVTWTLSRPWTGVSTSGTFVASPLVFSKAADNATSELQARAKASARLDGSLIACAASATAQSLTIMLDAAALHTAERGLAAGVKNAGAEVYQTTVSQFTIRSAAGTSIKIDASTGHIM